MARPPTGTKSTPERFASSASAEAWTMLKKTATALAKTAKRKANASIGQARKRRRFLVTDHMISPVITDISAATGGKTGTGGRVPPHTAYTLGLRTHMIDDVSSVYIIYCLYIAFHDLIRCRIAHEYVYLSADES